jgi:hypothetical protein
MPELPQSPPMLLMLTIEPARALSRPYQVSLRV